MPFGKGGDGDVNDPTRHRASEDTVSSEKLPTGVSSSEWDSEKSRVQNPCIRTYLGCIRLLEEVLDSNYAILHCSPRRLLKIWRQVREVCDLIRSDLSPTLAEPSVISALDEARRHAHVGYRDLAGTVLPEIDRYPQRLLDDQVPKVRKLLCVAIGKIYAFLRDTFGELLAADPRSRHDADYFLSKRFAQDIEESEWLYASVYELGEYLDGLQRSVQVVLKEVLSRTKKDRMIPHDSEWAQIESILSALLEGLVPKLNDVVTNQAIRVYDLETLDKYAFDIAYHCKTLVEVYGAGREVIEKTKAGGGPSLPEREQTVRNLMACHDVVSRRLNRLLSTLHDSLCDLATYVPTWRLSIEKRRALMLSKNPDELPANDRTTVRNVY